MSVRRAFLIADLGFGDSGKGTIVDYLTQHQASLIVRYNGGPQAAHNVITPDGRHHTFAQFGSGMFRPATRTLLGRHMLIEPYAMLNEADHLHRIGVPDALGRTVIDARCRVITPPQQIANRIRERARGAAAHGTCGMGIGETVADSIEQPKLTLHAADLGDSALVRRRLREMRDYKRSQLADLMQHALPSERQLFEDPQWIDTAVREYQDLARRAEIAIAQKADLLIRESDAIVFEGAQGVLLDERWGFDPHTTWSDTTFTHADTMLHDAGYAGDICKIGVTRTYCTRHGAGPMVSELPSLSSLDELHNSHHGLQGRFRCGVLDLVGLRYALHAAGRIDGLAVTHLDRIGVLPPRACDSYEIGDEVIRNLDDRTPASRLIDAKPVFIPWPTDSADSFVEALRAALSLPTLIRSDGPTYLDKAAQFLDNPR